MTVPPYPRDRLGRRLPSEYDDAQGALHSAIVSEERLRSPSSALLRSRDGALEGPFIAMLESAAIGMRLEALGGALRFEGALPGRLRELVILATAVSCRCSYEWHAHTPVARMEGITDDYLEALLDGCLPARVSEEDALLLEVVGVICDGRSMSDDVYWSARARYGESGLVEIVCLVGYYRLLATLTGVFQIELPEGYADVLSRAEPSAEVTRR